MSTAAPIWEIRLLGGLRARRGATEISRLGGLKHAALLALLAMRPGQPRRRDELVEQLWPGVEPEVGRNRLSVALSWLRRGLEGDAGLRGALFQADRLAVWLVRDAVWVDVVALERALATPRGPARIGALEEALQLYRGPLLPEHDEEWIAPEAARLETRILEAAQELASHQERAGEHGRAVETLLVAVAADPGSVALELALMKQYEAAGRHAAGAEQARGWERAWSQRSGRAAPAAVLALRQRLEQAAARPAPPPLPAAPAPAPTPVARALPPAPLTRLFGREEALAEISAAVAQGARLISVVGPAGAGRTRLLREAARRLTRPGEPILELTLGHLEAPIALEASVEEALRAWPREGAGLLLLHGPDRHRPQAARAVAEALAARPGLRVWLSAQRPLQIAGEQVLPARPLPLPAAGAPREALLASPGVALFVDRARAAAPDLALDAENIACIAAICRALDGLPLAIAEEAARLGPRSLPEILAGLADRLDRRGEPRTEHAPPPRSLEQALADSVALAPAELREALALLSVFPADFDVTAAEAVLRRAPASALLAELAAWSLLQALGESPPRYRMLQSLRASLAGRLAPADRDAARARREDFYLEQARRCRAAAGSPDHARWIQRLLRDWEQHREILLHARLPIRVALAVELEPYELGQGPDAEVVEVYEALLREPLPARTRVHLLAQLLAATRLLGDSRRMARHLEALAAIDLAGEDAEVLARALGVQANHAIDQGALEAAEALTRRAASLGAGPTPLREAALRAERLARIALQSAAYGRALSHLDEAERDLEQLGDAPALARMRLHRALVHLDQGDPWAAAEALGPEGAEGPSSPTHRALIPVLQANIALEQGLARRAWTLAEAAAAHYQATGARRHEAFAQMLLATAALLEGAPDRALALADASALGFRSQRLRVELPRPMILGGLALILGGEVPAAALRLREAARLLAPMPGPRFAPLALESWAALHLSRGEAAAAAACLGAAARTRLEVGARATWEAPQLAALRQRALAALGAEAWEDAAREGEDAGWRALLARRAEEAF